MARFAPNYTARYMVRYRAAGREHVAKFRYGLSDAAPSAAFIAGVGAFLDALRPLLVRDFTLLGAAYIAQGANFSLPAALPELASAASDFDWTKGDSPRFFSFVGRSITGQPTTVMVYGAVSDPGANNDLIATDNRVLSAESATVANAVAALTAIGGLTASDGTSPFWASYANVAYNAYYQRKNRRG